MDGNAAEPAIRLSEERRAAFARYGVAVVAPALALLLRGALPLPDGTSVYQLPLAAVVMSAWYGGRKSGLVATLLAAPATLFFFVPPVYSFHIAPEHALGFGLFLALCVLIAQLSDARWRAARAMRATAARFQTFVDHANDAMLLFDDRLTVIDANREACSSLGYDERELIGLTPRAFDPTFDDEAWARLVRRAREPEFEATRHETRHRRKDGSEFPVEVHTSRFRDGGRYFFLSIVRDITERKRAEAQQRTHVRFLESMDRINRAMQGTNDLTEMMGDVLAEVLELFSADRAWLLYPCDPDTPSWRPVMERTRPDFPGATAHERSLPMTAEGAALIRAALASAGALRGGPGHERQVSRETSEQFRVQSEMLMALRPKEDKAYLFGVHQCSHPRSWTEHEKRLFEEIGHRLTDTLGRLSAVRRLLESERRLEAAQRTAHVGWWDRDYVQDQVSLSDEACRILGVEPPLDLHRWHERWLSAIHPDDRQKTAHASELALRGEARYDVEYRVVWPDGTIRIVRSQGDVTRDDSGRAVRQFGVLQDITELRAAEHEARGRQEMLDIAQRAARAVAFDWPLGPGAGQLRWSPELEAMFGLEHLEFDRTYEGWKKLVYPDDWPSVAQAIQDARQSGDFAAEYRVVHRRGNVHWLQARGRMFVGANRQADRIVGFMIDVTDRRRAEEELRATEARFRTFVDQAKDAMFLLDDRLRVIDASRQACQSLGYAFADLVGLTPRAFDTGLSDEAWAKLQRRAVEPTFDTLPRETRYRRKDGSSFPVEVHTSRFEDGGRFFYLSIVRDITERKRADEALRSKDDALQTARAELARVSRLTTLGELTASIAHEVNQPLGAMVTGAGACARWLAAQPPNMEEAQTALENVIADGKRAGAIVSRIRALTKREAPRKEPVDANRKIAEVVALAAHELRSQDILLSTDLDEALPPVTADGVQLQQVLLNLIVNAIEAMAVINDRPRELNIVSTASDANTVLIEVRDSGPGLQPQQVDRVFEAFYTTKAQGIGIGLSISRSIVEAHGGRLWAAANQPNGAVFRFTLPVASEATG